MWTPDDLDVQIIRALASPKSFQWDVRIPYSSVAETLDIDEETVRNRLRFMEEAKFLRGWQLVLNPMLLGREAAIVELHVAASESKAVAISRLKMVEGVMLVDDLYGREIAVTTLFEKDAGLQAQVEMFASLCGCTDPVSWKLGFPACDLTPSNTDWRIIQVMRRTGRVSVADVASDLSLSTRTVHRRLNVLVEANAFYLDPVLDLSSVGGVRCRLWVTCEAGRKRAIDQEILSKLARIITTHTAPAVNSIFVAHLSNTGEVQKLLEWVSGLEGVAEARATIEVEHIHVQDWVERQIENQLMVPAD
jgi:DNA-binding Lrp family transcriptional regulator